MEDIINDNNVGNGDEAPITYGGDSGDTTEYLWNGKQIFYGAAKALQPITDKVTMHTYQVMYGMFLMPYQIGLGCDMDCGPGASVAIYQKLFPKAELWEAEYDAKCVEKNRDGMLEGINILTGDQGNETVLDEWILTYPEVDLIQSSTMVVIKIVKFGIVPKVVAHN